MGLKQSTGVAGIFADQNIALRQGGERAQSDIRQVADRAGNQIQGRIERLQGRFDAQQRRCPERVTSRLPRSIAAPAVLDGEATVTGSTSGSGL